MVDNYLASNDIVVCGRRSRGCRPLSFGCRQEQSRGGGVLPAERARYREVVMELLRILETPVVVRVVMALSLAMMLAVIIGLI